MTVLGVFFTRGVSLKQWVDSGLYDREVLIYQQHLRSGLFERIYWFTYGGADLDVAARLREDGRLPAGIQIVQRPAWIGCFGRAANLVYTLLMPLLAFRFLRKCNVFKTNQMDGAIAAVVSSAMLRCPLYVRTGYTLSLFVDRIHANNPLRRRFAWLTEYIAFNQCSASSVSSRFDRDYVAKRYALAGRAPVIVGNYIDTEAFRPRSGIVKIDRLLFVGRLSPEKNLNAAIAACADAGIGLDIVGDGPDKKMLEETASAKGADVSWIGVVPNGRLPELLCGYQYFILPSLWEGMPKALLEAMAAGLVCIGTDTTGINEVITDGVTGYLSSGPSALELTKAIRRAIEGDKERISSAATDLVVQTYSLTAIASKESEIFNSLLSTSANRCIGENK